MGMSVPPLMSFNSSLVRLGASRGLVMDSGLVVSIPAWCDWEQHHAGGFGCQPFGFNSSLVRLGVLRQAGVELFGLAFQFQLGAIGSNTLLCIMKTTLEVSIPAWCDWEHPEAVYEYILPASFNSSLVRLGGY